MTTLWRIIFLSCAALCSNLLFFAAPAAAKQCVFNKGGYVLHVHWYRPADVHVNQAFTNGGSVEVVMATGRAVQTAALTAGFGDCTKTNETLVAFLSVPGTLGSVLGEGVGSSATLITPGTPVSTYFFNNRGEQVNRPVAPLVCAASLRGHCLPKAVLQEVRDQQPGRMLLVTAPSHSQYLDFVGTFAEVRWMPGGPVQ